MKKSLIVLFLILAPIYNLKVFSQEINEENYNKEDRALWSRYEERVNEIFSLMNKYPEMEDSLQNVYKYVLDSALIANANLALKYSSTESGFDRVFRCRLKIPKDTLQRVINTTPDSLKNTECFNMIKMHIDTKQVEANDKYQDFKAFDSNGDEFSLYSLEGQRILLLYGGLECMGKAGQDILAETYKTQDPEKFKIVIFYETKDIEELKNIKDKYESGYIFISDFKEDYTPFKVIYGAQGTPTCFFIDVNGMVKWKTEGMPYDLIVE